ncbi:HAMP domain-containing histidine kinase [Burkholderia ambifaria]|uniref:sensor histidine kinase n=1 Tax=Burkholderia ambifaria TaxID=152480 RepID=UPI001B99D843|nr:HAMP domain-containing sensor histidine kinase [Burkholderia ambifaria]MBR8185337.1 HAMP domain-containing histidine kinase [Burkholderia ambifaria]
MTAPSHPRAAADTNAPGIAGDELAALLDSQPWGTIAVDRERRVLFASTGAARLLQREIVVGASLDALLRACGIADVAEPTQTEDANPSEDAGGQGVEFQVGDTWIWLARNQASGGGRIATTFVLVDVTGMRRTLDQRMESLRFMSHDLRSPQNSILAMTQLHETDPAAFDACGGMARIGELARYALSLGDQFIFTSVESGLQRRDLARFDLCETVRSVIAQQDVAAVYRGVPLQLWMVEDARIWMTGVRTFVARALQNLVDNAIRASTPGNAVTVSVNAEDGFAVVTVSDAAGGLPGIAALRVMSDFEALADRSSSGSGLGLKLTSRIVNLHGGTLLARANPRAGTDFVMRLPCLSARRNTGPLPGGLSTGSDLSALERADALAYAAAQAGSREGRRGHDPHERLEHGDVD